MTERLGRQVAPIVVGVDGSETGRRALSWALAEARARHCEVQVVHVWSCDPSTDLPPRSNKEMHQRSRSLVRREVETVTEGMTELPVITQVSIPGYPAGVLVEVSQGARMLVIGRHSGGVLRRAVVGSVSSACVRRALCPVAVVPERDSRTNYPAGA